MKIDALAFTMGKTRAYLLRNRDSPFFDPSFNENFDFEAYAFKNFRDFFSDLELASFVEGMRKSLPLYIKEENKLAAEERRRKELMEKIEEAERKKNGERRNFLLFLMALHTGHHDC